MKKRIFILAALALISLTGSGLAQGTDTLEKIAGTGTVTLGVRESSGLGYSLGNGKYVGFHTEMAEHIVDDLSKIIGRKIRINYLPITSANRIPLVQNGTYDFECGSTTNTRARANEAAFANTTYVEEVRIAVKNNSGIKNITDLNGKTVVTTTGTTAVQTLRRNKRAENLRFNDIRGKDHIDSFLLLQSGRADAFVMDGSILAAIISKSPAPSDFVILDDILSVEPIACMMRLNDGRLKDAINQSISRQIRDGSMERLYNKWFMKPIPPTQTVVGLPLSRSTRDAWENPNSKPMEDYPQNNH